MALAAVEQPRSVESRILVLKLQLKFSTIRFGYENAESK